MLKEKVRIFVRVRPTLHNESPERIVHPLNTSTMQVQRRHVKFNLRFDEVLSSESCQNDVFNDV